MAPHTSIFNIISSPNIMLGITGILCFPGNSDDKESVCNAGDLGSTPGPEHSPGGGHDNNPLQYSCLENSMKRGALRATVYGVTKSST